MRFVLVIVIFLGCVPAALLAQASPMEEASTEAIETKPLDKFARVTDAFEASGGINFASSDDDEVITDLVGNKVVAVVVTIVPRSTVRADSKELTPSGAKVRIRILDAFGDRIHQEEAEISLLQLRKDVSEKEHRYGYLTCLLIPNMLPSLAMKRFCDDRNVLQLPRSKYDRLSSNLDAGTARVDVEVLSVSFTNGDAFTGQKYRTARPLTDELSHFRIDGDDRFDEFSATPETAPAALRLSVGMLAHRFFEDANGISAIYFTLLGFSPSEKEVTGAEIEYAVYDSLGRRVLGNTRRIIADKHEEGGLFFSTTWVKTGTFATKKRGDSDFEQFPELGESDYIRLAEATRTFTYRVTAKVKRVFFSDGSSVGTGRRGK